jgi:hypothetical protein
MRELFIPYETAVNLGLVSHLTQHADKAVLFDTRKLTKRSSQETGYFIVNADTALGIELILKHGFAISLRATARF